MIDQWYYWRGAEVLGPISGQELTALGASGGILPLDTVWREGFEHGVPASRVKNLFPAGETPVPVAEPERVPVKPALQARKARAVAGKGTVIVGQNGTSVRYQMQCTTCGHKDNSVKSWTIVRGSTRLTFFCPKCRKSRPTELNGFDR